MQVEQRGLKSIEDVRRLYRIHEISPTRVVFKITAHEYRVDTIIEYDEGDVVIKRVGTHEAYNKWKYE